MCFKWKKSVVRQKKNYMQKTQNTLRYSLFWDVTQRLFRVTTQKSEVIIYEAAEA